jgi:hypothetical protein
VADANIGITPGTGALADTRTNAAGEHRQVVILGNDGDTITGMEPWGALPVSLGPSVVLYDAWSTSPIDTTDRWTVTGTAPTISGGNMVMPATVSTYNAIRSKDPIRPGAGFTYSANGITLETAVGTGAGRFWGMGTPATTPAAAVLAQDGIGFEIDQATGALLAVTYSGGVRTSIATLTRPADGAIHRYALYFRATAAYWFIDNMNVPVATITFPNMAVVELPALIVRQNAATLAGAPVFTNIAHMTADTAAQNRSIVDPVIGTRTARVSPLGALSVNLAGSGSAVTPAIGNLTAVGAATVAGSASTTGQIVLDVSASGNASFHLLATAFVGTVTFEQSFDAAGTAGTWAQVSANAEDGANTPYSSLAINTAVAYIRQFSLPTLGPALFRVRCSAFTSGSLGVRIVGGAFAYENAVVQARGTSPTQVNVPSSATSGTILAANPNRLMARIWNDSTQILYLNESGAAASTTAWTNRLAGGQYYELPHPVHTGLITGIWAAANGNARVTEW